MSGQFAELHANVNLAVGALNPDEARAAALYVADQLGDECRDALEALGLIGYVGHDSSGGHRRRVWRTGVCA